jgi:hypothetical protein
VRLGPLRRMQLLKAYPLRRDYSVAAEAAHPLVTLHHHSSLVTDFFTQLITMPKADIKGKSHEMSNSGIFHKTSPLRPLFKNIFKNGSEFAEIFKFQIVDDAAES